MTTTTQYDAANILRYGKASPSVSIVSVFNDIAMNPNFFGHGIEHMTHPFWSGCRQASFISIIS